VQVGIDSYCYHRLFGDVRPGERAAAVRWPLDPQAPTAHAAAVGADALYLETAFLAAPPTAADQRRTAAAGVDLGLSWGHGWPEGRPHGLHGGRVAAARAELAGWIDVAAGLGHRTLRITAGSPATRGSEPASALVDRLVAPLQEAAAHAERRGVDLALENHGDLRAADLVELLERVGHPRLGVTLDTVNLIRLGDDMVDGTRVLAPHTRLVHLKDHLPGPVDVPGGPVCTALGDGCADLEGVLAALAAAGFDGPVCVELASLGPGDVDELALVERSVAWLRAALG
jgi:3-oxoisoapionate decarboxylase